MNDMKKHDRGYMCIRRYIKKRTGGNGNGNGASSKKEGRSVPFKVEMYNSGTCNENWIRHAITGYRYPHWNIGSIHEERFFKVRLCDTGYSNVTLFYESPEEMERHQHLKLDDATKEAWHARRQRGSG
jgi:hypothetical protein